jgi:2-oxoisovalerate dehydrogenase E2 component (dihydrolipoyl transacylase)
MPDIVMPQPGQSVTEGTILRWLKAEGDEVAEDEIVVEVETEKVNVEVPSPVAGTLTRIIAHEGETVPVGAALAVIGAESEPGGADAGGASGTERLSAAADGVQMTDGEQPPATPAAARGVLVGADGASVEPVGAALPAQGANGSGEAAQRYSPAVLRLAAEHHLDLARIPGTGMGGRVTRKDVTQFLERGPTASAPTPGTVASVAAPTQPAAAPPSQRQPATTPPAALAASASTPQMAPPPMTEDEEVIQPSPTRLTIARNMTRVAQTVPVAWMVVEVDVTGLVRLREASKAAFRQREGVDLTYLPFVIQAATGALKEHPLLNSEWRDERIIVKKRLNIGVAVGVEEGLIVPVIKDADRLSLSGLAHALADLSGRARARKLRLDDVTGGSFTIDNTGVFGSLVSQPIINPPQAAIVSTEAIVKRPMVRDDAIAIRSLMNLCISFDHRVLDGSQVGPFMQALKERLEAIGPETFVL